MRVKIKNVNGGSISVDIEMNDTPKQIIAKAIAQNDKSDVAVIFADETALNEISEGIGSIETTLSNFVLSTREGVVPLEWDVSVGKQVETLINQIINEGYEVEFYACICQIA